jgi:hypothetical protein
MTIASRIIITVGIVLAAIAATSFAFEAFAGHPYPALVIATSFVIVSPMMFLLWRDRLTEP